MDHAAPRSCKIWIDETDYMFDIFDPDPGKITLPDIARTLSNLCRWGGRRPHFYSVAQHSVHVSRLVQRGYDYARSREVARWGLLHDAAEAFIGDIPAPLKAQTYLGGLPVSEVENRLLEVIAWRFGLEWPMPAIVHAADAEAATAERGDWSMGGLPPPRAMAQFLAHAEHLKLDVRGS